MPCVGGGDAGRGYGGLVGAHQRGSLEVEEKLIAAAHVCAGGGASCDRARRRDGDSGR